jgi:hypothetical protein
MEEFWMVWRLNGASPTRQHECFYDAKREAERLAASIPDVKFVILRSVGYCETVNPVIYKEVEERLPF